jgi:hypothetical protein
MCSVYGERYRTLSGEKASIAVSTGRGEPRTMRRAQGSRPCASSNPEFRLPTMKTLLS